MTSDVETIVIGAGVVGLAVAAELAARGREVIVVERHTTIGSETSSRNSEVIHAGIYYPPGSAKARHCIAGKQRLYAFCDAYGVPYRRAGKYIVASGDAERAALERLRENAVAAGMAALEWIDRAELLRREPAVRADVALYSPTSGIVDSHAMMTALQGRLESEGGQVALTSGVAGIARKGDLFAIELADPDGYVLTCRELVNCAGLAASALAQTLDHGGWAPPPTRYARGAYFALTGKSPFSSLIYPIPVDGGLGIHATLDLGGQCRFGPDVEWIESIDYAFPDGREAAFRAAIARYWPAVAEAALQPGYTGIRPKLAGPGEPFADFLIAGEETHGMAGLVHMLGIESPGLTASLSLADAVADRLADNGRAKRAPAER